MARVAVLGTGIMGGPIARHLHRAGNDVVVWNRTRAKAEAVGASVAASPAEAVAGADAVVTMLADGPAVEEVVVASGALEAFEPGSVWIQMSTVGLAALERLASAAAQRSIPFVDAPVLGTREPAEAGELAVLASGPAAERERVEQVLDPAARAIFWLGEAGAGTRLKLVVNGWIFEALEGLAETIAFAEHLDVDPRHFLDAIRGGGMDMGYAHTKGELMLNQDFPPSFPLRLARKDLALVLEAAGDLELPAARAVLAQFDRALELGHGDDDMAAVFCALESGS